MKNPLFMGGTTFWGNLVIEKLIATMNWFSGKLYSRFTDIQAQMKHLYTTSTKAECEKYLIKPVGQIDIQIIENQWHNLQRIIATLAFKETTQSTLIKKLCTYKQEHRIRKALISLRKISPVAWQHINFIGRLNFSEECIIDLEGMVSQLKVAA